MIDFFSQSLQSPFAISAEGSISRAQILSVAYQLAEEFKHNKLTTIVNLCEKRHEFLAVMFATAIHHGKLILPPDVSKQTLEDLRSAHHNIEFINSVDKDFTATATTKAVEYFEQHSIDKDEIWLHTSGSTGNPKRIVKTFADMYAAAKAAIERLELTAQHIIIGTTPSQHMYALEATIFWPWLSGATVWQEKPFFSEDLVDAVNASQQYQQVFISTPFHLEKVLCSQYARKVDLSTVISATAPLSSELARKIEQATGAKVMEVYGSTEVASIASRETTKSEYWQPYTGFKVRESAGDFEVLLPYLPDNKEWHVLNDSLQINPDGTFKLLGRDNDLLKVAGKRSSLSLLNQHLNSVSGIEEGVIIQPELNERPVAYVVSKMTRDEIHHALLALVDAVFIPRQIHYLESIPRNETGKIKVQMLQKMVKKV